MYLIQIQTESFSFNWCLIDDSVDWNSLFFCSFCVSLLIQSVRPFFGKVISLFCIYIFILQTQLSSVTFRFIKTSAVRKAVKLSGLQIYEYTQFNYIDITHRQNFYSLQKTFILNLFWILFIFFFFLSYVFAIFRSKRSCGNETNRT